jgi:hypothetical protein
MRDDIHETPDVSHIQNPDVSHEHSDVNIRSIVVFAVGLVAVGLITHVLMLVMYKALDAREAKRKDSARPPMALTEKERIPPEPRLQAAPGFGVDAEKERAEELREAGYRVDQDGRVDLSLREPQAEMRVVRQAWEQQLKGGEKAKDPLTGQPRIPIEQAKQMFLQKQAADQSGKGAQGGAPPRQAVDVQGLDIPSFWSSGRQTEKSEQ